MFLDKEVVSHVDRGALGAADVKAAAATVMSTDDKMEGATELDVE